MRHNIHFLWFRLHGVGCQRLPLKTLLLSESPWPVPTVGFIPHNNKPATPATTQNLYTTTQQGKPTDQTTTHTNTPTIQQTPPPLNTSPGPVYYV